MSMLSWLLNRSRHDDRGDHQQMKKMVERVVGMSPPLRLARNFEARLLPALTEAVRYIERLTAEVPAAREATAAAWSSDPCIHAFFAAPQDVCAALSQSEHLRSYFSTHAESVEAFAVLGMAMDQRHVFGVAQHGVVTRSDVAQTTVSFSDHQVRVCGATDTELRQQIMLRLLDQLTLQGLQKSKATSHGAMPSKKSAHCSEHASRYWSGRPPACGPCWEARRRRAWARWRAPRRNSIGTNRNWRSSVSKRRRSSAGWA